MHRIAEEPWDAPEGTALRLAQRAELDARYGSDDHEPGSAPTADDIAVFLVARDATGAAVGCGGLRPLDTTSAEVKRMYVVPQARGTGVAAALLRALEEQAVARGWRTLRLETGTFQPDAVRFYQREGYVETPLFGVYVGSTVSRCFVREL